MALRVCPVTQNTFSSPREMLEFRSLGVLNFPFLNSVTSLAFGGMLAFQQLYFSIFEPLSEPLNKFYLGFGINIT